MLQETHLSQDTSPDMSSPWTEPKVTALLVLANGLVLEGFGLGAEREISGEVCFNTAITGYQEILTDPSYQGQIVTFTFPHIGNVGVNDEDIEMLSLLEPKGASGMVVHSAITEPANWRAHHHLDTWLKARNMSGISGIDTRALTGFIRDHGMMNAILAYDESGVFDREALKQKAAQLPSMEGLDLVPGVTSVTASLWNETIWNLETGYGQQNNASHHVVAIDYGVKRNILRLLADVGCKVTLVPAQTSAQEILALRPDGVFLSNGPGDPAATGVYAVPVIQELIRHNVPIFGICLGHQILALALGGQTEKMAHGHHGANHPVKDVTTGKVEIVSMNHGFAVDASSLPEGVMQTHVSLFDGTNCGLMLKDKPVFSVQHHPEASPGPQDSHYLFTRFVEVMKQKNLVNKIR